MRWLALALLPALAGCGAKTAHRAAHPVREVVRVDRVATVQQVAAGARGLHCRPRRRRFVTLPHLRPTAFCVAIRRGAAVSGDPILVTPRPNPQLNPHEQFGLMLVSPGGKLLWYARRLAKVHDLKTVTYRGQPMLSYFERGHGGFDVLLDEHYRPVARIHAVGGQTDEHDLRIEDGATAWLGSHRVVGHGRLTDYAIERIDVATGKLRWRWRAHDHVPARDSFAARPRRGEPWDYFHGNAIDPPTADDPTLMLSARNTSAIYGIDPGSGRIAWTLGGKRDQFHLARHPGWVFCAQHDARRLPGGRLLLFDNGGTEVAPHSRCPVHPARAMLFRLDVAHRRVKLLRSFPSTALRRGGLASDWVGSAQLVAGGALVDWGSVPRVSEFGRDGREDLLLQLSYWSYRAPAVRWVGRPLSPPAIAARRHGADVTLWASWNGATEVRRWQVLAGPSPDRLAPFGAPVPFEDLETRMRVRSGRPWFAVRALGAGNAALSTSRPMRAGRG
jgi:hypothetical protein